MAGKSKQQKKKRAKMKKQVSDGLRQKPKTIVVNKTTAVGPTGTGELVQKDEVTMGLAKAADIGLKRVEEMDIEESFDPKSVVANILKKKDEDK